MTLAEASRYLLAQAHGQGIGAEVIGEGRRELTARTWRGHLDQITQADRGGIGVRVVVEGRVGYAYSEELSPAALDWMLAEAIANASLQDAATGFLPHGSSLGHHDLVGHTLAGSLDAKVQTALGLEATLREDRRLKEVIFATYTEHEHELNLASTQGTGGSYRRGAVGIGGSIVMQEGSSRKQGWEVEWVTQLRTLNPGRTALDLTERTGRLLGARPLKTGRYTAYFEPKAFADLLAAFWHLWNGKAVVEGKSRFRGRLGEAIAAPLVTLVDDPTLPDGLATRPFDAEGAPAQATVLVEEGILRAYLTNSETARALAIGNTGHAARGYKDVLHVAPSNLYVRPGAGITMHRGVVITETMGSHAGTNPISGAFSVQALGLWVEEGQVLYPVENFAVAGDFLRLLERITAVGATLDWRFWGRMAFGAPMVEVADLSFAGT